MPILLTATPGRSIAAALLLATVATTCASATDGFAVERFATAAWVAGDGRTRAAVVVDRDWSFLEASAFAEALGARLAPAPSPALLGFIGALANLEGAFECDGPWIGGSRDALGAWAWSDGTTFVGFGFAPGRPAQSSFVPAALLLGGTAVRGGAVADGTWLDALPSPDAGTSTRAAMLEWTSFTDCDLDGAPDALEIAGNPSLDADGDGTLDGCSGNPADLDGDGIVGAADLSILLASWGAEGPPGTIPADLSGNGVVDAADLSALLAAWGTTSDSRR